METIPDRIEAKRDLLERLDAICPRELVLASCSATIPITLLEETVEQRNRVVIANFWFDTPLVEVVRGTSTDEQTVDSVMQYSRTLGKHPVLLSKDCPGHVCCRMFLGQVYRALRILEAGVATAEDIDICMTLGSAYSSGILRRCDRMGLDFVQQAFLIMYELTGEPRFKPNRVIEQKVEAGKLGEKTGEGFFTWPDR
jgi:3-hydroxybutyryl-CoA dehydrogenase